MRRFLPVLVLIVLTPLVAEVLPGSTPITMPGLLLIDLLIYGPGALLIRELVRRRGRSWGSILLLGAAYGLIEEGLALQSLFHPAYANVALWGARLFGVNWVYSGLVLIWIHPVWSAAIPILLTELVFPAQRALPYLRRSGLVLISIWYILGAVLLGFFARTLYPYNVSLILPGAVILIVSILVVVALFVLPRQIPQEKRLHNGLQPRYVFLFASLSAFVALALPALFWHILPSLAQFPLVLIPLLVPPIVAVVLIRFIQHWVEAFDWNDRHVLALVSGLLLAHTIVGGLLFSKTIMQGITIGIMGLMMFIVLTLFALRVRRRVATSVEHKVPTEDDRARGRLLSNFQSQSESSLSKE